MKIVLRILIIVAVCVESALIQPHEKPDAVPNLGGINSLGDLGKQFDEHVSNYFKTISVKEESTI